MCGIAGWLNGERIDAERVLARLRHRGPDGEGASALGVRPSALGGGSSAFGVGTSALGGDESGPRGLVHLLHTRLSIIDLSDAGAQPMREARTGNAITFNGEIYNFRSLRDELSETGEPWLSHSDTEVILRAWRRWDCRNETSGLMAACLIEPPVFFQGANDESDYPG